MKKSAPKKPAAAPAPAMSQPPASGFPGSPDPNDQFYQLQEDFTPRPAPTKRGR